MSALGVYFLERLEMALSGAKPDGVASFFNTANGVFGANAGVYGYIQDDELTSQGADIVSAASGIISSFTSLANTFGQPSGLSSMASAIDVAFGLPAAAALAGLAAAQMIDGYAKMSAQGVSDADFAKGLGRVDNHPVGGC